MANTNNGDKLTYSIVGRYMTGSAVSAYHLIGSDGKDFKATRELTCYLIGKGLVTNCKGQMNGGDVALRGIGISLTELPVKNERTGEITRTDNIGIVKPKNSNDNTVFSQLVISARLFQDGKCVGYIVRNAGGAEKKLERNAVLKLASERKIGNARINMDNGVPILRGVGVELDKLPVVQMAPTRMAERQPREAPVSTVNIKTIKVNWNLVQQVMLRYESKFTKDPRNNANDIYQYPVLDLMSSHSATMVIIASGRQFKITNVRKGISAQESGYGLEFILSNNGERIKIVCEDINYLVFNIHVLGFIAMTALMKINRECVASEFIFENRVEKLIWREYSVNSENNSIKIDNATKITFEDANTIENEYNIELNPISSLGERLRYPTVQMVANGKARMGINTSLGYYEIARVKFGYNNGQGIALELKNKALGSSNIVTSSNLTKDKITVKNISLISCAALLKINQRLIVTEAIAENEAEQSVISYLLTRKQR